MKAPALHLPECLLKSAHNLTSSACCLLPLGPDLLLLCPTCGAAAAGAASTSTSVSLAGVGAGAAAAAVDAQYFDSYSGFDIHQEMLSDKVRACCC
jgi:hypothetical protein